MKLRTQLLLINVVSLGLLVGALLYSYGKMLLTLEQARWLTVIALAAGAFSALAYWLMTKPITNALNRLVFITEKIAERRFSEVEVLENGPMEIKQLSSSVRLMGQRLQQSFQLLEETERSRRELVANVSHDLRTPLASIQSFVEALQDGVLEDSDTKERYLATIRLETNRLGVMIEDLFELSKLEAGQQSFEPVLTHLDQVLLEVLESHEVLLREKKLKIHVKVADNLPPLWIMPVKIERVVGNLLQNAIRYSPSNGIIDLEADYDQTKEIVEVVIRDQGEGIPASERERIFQRFYRTDQSRNRESGGAGLGLAIASSLVKLHNGQIGVRERKDGKQGSEFWFTLPHIKKKINRNL